MLCISILRISMGCLCVVVSVYRAIMPCYRPLAAWRGDYTATGKRSIVFSPPVSTGGSVFPTLKVPCGQCIGCRLDYSLDWATRCLHENQMHKASCFITLTYNNINLPRMGQLVYRDFQLFTKRLRKEIRCPIKFYMAGEYGEKLLRPHYHALIFGYDFPDRIPFKRTSSGEIISRSAMLSGLWQNGYVSVGNVTFESAAYVARYCMKKVTGQNVQKEDANGLKVYERLDVESGSVETVPSEFVRMSRGGRGERGGIAKGWYEKYKSDVYPQGYCVLRGGVKMPPPRYYDKKYELENPVDMLRIKSYRQQRAEQKEMVRQDKKVFAHCVLPAGDVLEDRDSPARLKVMEEVKNASVALLKRGKVECGE